MKKLLVIGMSLSIGIFLTSCKQHRYVNLVSGERIDLTEDENGRMIDAKTHRPVEIYVDTRTNDTIYGPTGAVINGHVVKTKSGKWRYDTDEERNYSGGEYKAKSGDYKIKVDGDEIKIKDGDKKIKIENGERKVKND